MKMKRLGAAIAVLLGALASGCARHHGDRSSEALAQLRANVCSEGESLPHRLAIHLIGEGQWRDPLRTGRASAHDACLDLQTRAREVCGQREEFERLVGGSAGELGLHIDPAQKDPFGKSVCDSLETSLNACAANPETDSKKALDEVEGFEGRLGQRLRAVMAGCGGVGTTH